MAQLFVQVSPAHLQRMQSAAARVDSAGLRSEAQKMMKAAERIAAVEVSRCAHKIEEAAASGDFQTAHTELDALEREITRLDAHLRLKRDAFEEVSSALPAR
jgi:HPt (histidine-containing phosphotransfer) domain-containing protein